MRNFGGLLKCFYIHHTLSKVGKYFTIYHILHIARSDLSKSIMLSVKSQKYQTEKVSSQRSDTPKLFHSGDIFTSYITIYGIPISHYKNC